jgi:putative hydrolase of the HAD superfamily
MAKSRTRKARPVEVVIFDLGRVLIEVDWRRPLNAAARRARLAPAEAERRLLAGTLLPDFETGRLTPEEFHAGAERAWEARIPFDQFRELWLSIFGAEIPQTVKLVRGLIGKGQVRLAALSNTNAIHAEHLRRTWPLLNELPNVFLSHEIGYRKPDPAAYRHVMTRLAISGPEAVFVDDDPGNVAAAVAMGLRGIVAHSPALVVRELARLGVTADGRAPARRRSRAAGARKTRSL